MTQRKPPGTSWESWIEAQIRVAMEEGAFDNLPGAGKPLPNLDQEYDPLWWVKQLAQRTQISMLPPSLELLRKVETELTTIEKLDDEATVRRRVAAINVEIAKVNATVVEGPPTRLGTMDIDQVVARWRRTAPPILGSSLVSRPPRSDEAQSSDSRASHLPGVVASVSN
jgi:Domain of unknown function (DUF1992)